MSFTYDVGWQKRGSGRSYNSSSGKRGLYAIKVLLHQAQNNSHLVNFTILYSFFQIPLSQQNETYLLLSKKFFFQLGHGCLMGYYTGKIISYTTRSKDCKRCNAGQLKQNHDCRANYKGTSKAMEPDMAVELITKNPLFEKHKVFCGRLIMDDDCTTIDSLRSICKHVILKWSDKNHACKNFKKALYSLKLDSKLIDYLYKNFTAAIDNFKGDVDGLKIALTALVPHCYGEHDLCNFHEDKDDYKYKNIPNRKPLENQQLRISLDDLMIKYITNVDKLAAAASTQANESFNNIIISKCPKSKHYSTSESFNFRVAAGVCQKNLGFIYLPIVFNRLCLSPIKTNNLRDIKDRKKARKKLFEDSIEGKRKRKFRKVKKAQKDKNMERREGITYRSNVGFETSNEALEIVDCNTDILLDIPMTEVLNFKIVSFDIETTGLKAADQIVQVK